ncbi:MAG: rod shape-determining protein MreB [Microgenomates bacterium 39_6]|nr:MAG: rod shape-determining protein MreB [Microgenomates bacterium 39_6]
MWQRLFAKVSPGIAIDLGTANTLVYLKGQGLVFREPSVVARQRKSKKVLAVGTKAKKMIGKTPEAIEAFYPLHNGVIADFDAAEAMLAYYLNKVTEENSFLRKFLKETVIIGTPSGSTEVERRAVFDAAIEAGAGNCFLVEEPMAAAIGADLPVDSPNGSLVCDIGGGTTEIAIISLGGIVLNRSLKMAGHRMDEAIINFLRLKYSLLIGPSTAEEIKIEVGSALPQKKEPEMIVRGRGLEKGLPITVKVIASEIREAIAPILNQIIGTVNEMIEEAPPELVNDFLERGITLCGGGANLPGIDQLFSQETKMPVFIAEDPQAAVALGCGKLLEDVSLRDKVKIVGIN